MTKNWSNAQLFVIHTKRFDNEEYYRYICVS